MTIIGTNIGARGALPLISTAGELLNVADMPVLADGPKGRPAVNPALLADLIYQWRAKRAFIEFVGARPGEGPTGAFAFGRRRPAVPAENRDLREKRRDEDFLRPHG